MNNFEKYKDEINEIGYHNVYVKHDPSAFLKTFSNNQEWYLDELMNWLMSDAKEPLLNGLEKQFLENLMDWYSFSEVINKCACLELVSEKMHYKIPLTDELRFSKLDFGKRYTLEELGL